MIEGGRVVHMIAGGYALCRCDYDIDGTVTIAWGVDQVTCRLCLDLLGVRRDKRRQQERKKED